MDNPQEKPKNKPPYQMKGIPINAYLNENGEFKWIPNPTACTNKEDTKSILDVIKKMPNDRHKVWISRLDKEQTLTTCPIIQKEPDLHKEFDEISAAYNDQNPKNSNKQGGGEKNE
jgi:hypothetical protein